MARASCQRKMRGALMIVRALLCLSIIALGLALRGLGLGLGLPAIAVKYGGSILWGTMVFLLVAIAASTRSRLTIALIAAVIAVGVESFRLVHTPALDALSPDARRCVAARPHFLAAGYHRLRRRDFAGGAARQVCRCEIQGTEGPSLRKLKALAAIELFLDDALEVLARAADFPLADPAPFLHQEFLVRPIGLQINRGDDLATDQHRQREVAEETLVFRHISLETVLVVKEQMSPLALDDQGIERREDVHQFESIFMRFFQCLRLCPMLLLAGAFERHRDQLLAAHSCLDEAPDRLLARRIEVTDRVETHDPLRPQRAVEQIGRRLRRRGSLGRPVPRGMRRNQLIGLEHAVALADRESAGVETKLQRALRRLAARPQMLLFGEHVVLDIADGQRTIAPDPPHHLAHVGGLDRAEPAMALALVQLHSGCEETEIL